MSLPSYQFTLVLFCVLVSIVLAASPSGSLFGFAPVSSGTNLMLFDGSCGVVKTIASVSMFALHTDDQCSMDSGSGIFYANGFNTTTSKNQIVGVNVLSGAIDSITPLPSGFSGVKVAFNPNTKQLIVTGQNVTNPSQPWVTLTMQPGSSSYTQVATLPSLYIDVLGGPNAFDPTSNIQWISMGFGATITIVGINVNTGQIFNMTDVGMMETMDYDSTSNSIIGVGISTSLRNTAQRTLVKFYSQNTTDTIYANITGGWYMLDGGGSAIDSSSGTLYTIMSIGDQSPLEFLVSVNIHTGITSGATLVSSSVAPWCLGFLPSTSTTTTSINQPASNPHPTTNVDNQVLASNSRKTHKQIS